MQDAEDQRQPARDQEQQQPVLHAVQDLDQEEERVHAGAGNLCCGRNA